MGFEIVSEKESDPLVRSVQHRKIARKMLVVSVADKGTKGQALSKGMWLRNTSGGRS